MVTCSLIYLNQEYDLLWMTVDCIVDIAYFTHSDDTHMRISNVWFDI